MPDTYAALKAGGELRYAANEAKMAYIPRRPLPAAQTPTLLACRHHLSLPSGVRPVLKQYAVTVLLLAKMAGETVVAGRTSRN